MVEAMSTNQAPVEEAVLETLKSESPSKMDRLDRKINDLNSQILSL
jgi:hypothetical protein